MEVIEFLDGSGHVLVCRIPENGNLEIKWGSQLTVRESQEAVFFRDGQALDVFGPGRYVLKTQNIPVVGKWVTSFGYGPTSPFRAEVIFVGRQIFPNLKWGTREPVLFRDKELQLVRIRAYGSFSIQIIDSMLFVNKVVGTMGIYQTKHIEEYLRGIIISRLNVVLGRMLGSVFDVSQIIDQIGLALRLELGADIAALGLRLHDLYIHSVSVPDEVQRLIDSRAGLNAVGNLDDYLKLKVADALDAAASNQSDASSTVNAGVGLGLGMMIPGILSGQITGGDSVATKLKQLKELLDLGAIDQAEFDAKKKDLLKQM